MIQEDRQLLLKDLCARLPYGIIVNVNGNGERVDEINPFEGTITCGFQCFDIEECKPYLRPLSSMTEEESAELSNIISEWYDKELFDLTEEPFLEYALSKINYSISPQLFDWLNKKMFAYRHINGKNMFELGLAIEVTEENNPYK